MQVVNININNEGTAKIPGCEKKRDEKNEKLGVGRHDRKLIEEANITQRSAKNECKISTRSYLVRAFEYARKKSHTHNALEATLLFRAQAARTAI
jgi:hypothetical protein